mmetsp:Transcript_27062/g.45864  ORF Transcript_27062/g.45864 Transcript_27062/m.45864 type:complete len:116 (-) Transcript_27062:1196-1543(-)
MLTPSSNSNGLRIIFVFSRILAAQMKAEILSQLDNRRSFSKEAESSHHRQSSELELRSFWVDRTELIKFIHAAFSSFVSYLTYRCLLGHAVGSDRLRSNVAFDRCRAKAAIDKLK